MDVTTRAFSYFEVCARDGMVDLDELLAGVPLTRAQLEKPFGRVPWDGWAMLCNRFALLLGSDEAVRQSADATFSSEFIGPLKRLVGAIADTGDLYELAIRWLGPVMYRNLSFSITRDSPGHVRVDIRIPEDNLDSRAWLLMAEEAMRRLPRLLGQPDAQVKSVISPRHGEFVIELPVSHTALSHIRRAVHVLRSPRAIIDELAIQQRLLHETHLALQRSQRDFREAFELLPIAIGVHRDGRIQFANRRLAKMAGRSHGMVLLGSEVLDLFHPDDRPIAKERLEHAQVEPVELRLFAHGATVHADVGFISGLEFDGAPSALLYAIDLTAKRQAEAALEKSERTRRALLAALPDLVLRFSRSGDLLDVHISGAMSGAELMQPFIGMNGREIVKLLPDIPEGLLDRGMMLLEETAKTGKENVLELSSTALGEPRDFECRLIQLPHDEVLVLARDISEKKHAQQQFAVTERMASVGVLAASVAHEINNPLTFVMANLDSLLDDLGRADTGGELDTAAAAAAVRDALDGARRISKIASDLRVFSRSNEHGESELVDVREVLDSAMSLTANEIRHRAQLRRDLGDVPLVNADPHRLAQVFVNLLVNAAQALPDEAPPTGHEIRVTTGLAEDGRVAVAVTDTGKGISSANLSRIFEPFFTTKERHGGTGLGLPVCLRLVSEMGGDIQVESKLGAGARFTVLLPATSGRIKRAKARTEPPPQSAQVGKWRLIIVDDEPAILRALKRVLRDHDVETYSDPQAALDRLRAGPTPDLVLVRPHDARHDGHRAVQDRVAASSPS